MASRIEAFRFCVASLFGYARKGVMLNVPNLTTGARLKIKLGFLDDDLTFGLFIS